jgi:hypothetical protein
MSYEVARETLETRFNTQWASATKIRWQNVDDPTIPPANAAWVAFSILPGASTNVGVGANAKLHRESGIIDIGIYVPRGTGSHAAVAYADTASAIFRDWDDASSGITCYSPYMIILGPDEEYHHVSLTIPFRRDEVF